MELVPRLYNRIEDLEARLNTANTVAMHNLSELEKCRELNDEYEEVEADLLAACEQAEQTLRNLANGELSGDAYQIAINEAYNIKAVLAKARGETST